MQWLSSQNCCLGTTLPPLLSLLSLLSLHLRRTAKALAGWGSHVSWVIIAVCGGLLLIGCTAGVVYARQRSALDKPCRMPYDPLGPAHDDEEQTNHMASQHSLPEKLLLTEAQTRAHKSGGI